MSTKIQVRRGTATEWTTANPTLAAGEIGFESNTGRFKIGTGALWGSTVYASTAVADTALLSAANTFTQGQTVSSTGNASLTLNSGTGGAAGNQISFLDMKIDGTLKGNIAINESTSGNPLEINSATATNIALVTGGGNVGVGTNTPTAKLDVNGAVKATSFNTTTGTLVANTHATLTAGTTAMALATNSSVIVTPNATATYTSTVPAAGLRATVIILTSGPTSYTITFGTGFKPSATLATGTTTAKYWTVNFISDGTNLIETGRTGPL
jgi:hypothetical protein